MLVKSLELKDNARLAVRNNKHVIVNFNEVHQIILAVNGGGKTSLIRELSPLPATGSDYFKNGYKKIVIEHNNVEYELTSTYSVAAGKHSFINRNTGEELNPGGTQSVQRELVKEIFNYDDSLHEVLTDQIKFSNMNPTQRRDWLTRISGTNLDFAIDVFNKLKKKQKEEETIFKYFTKDVAKLSDGLISEEEASNIKRRYEKLQEDVKVLYENRITEPTPDKESALGFAQDRLRHIQFLLEEFLRIQMPSSIKRFKSLQEVNDRIISLGVESDRNDGQIEDYELEYGNLSRFIKEIESHGNIESIREQYAQLKTEIESKTQLVKLLPKDLENSIELYGIADSVLNPLNEIIHELPDNSNGYFSRDKLESYTEKLNEFNNRLTILEKQKFQLEHRKNHILNKEDIRCPECNSVFKPGVDVTDIPKIDTEISNIEIEISNLNNSKEQIVDYIDACNKYIALYKQFVNLKRQSSKIDFIWENCDLDLKSNQPIGILNKFLEYHRELEILSGIEKYLPEVYKLEAMLSKYDSLNKDLQYTQDRLEKLEKLIFDLRNKNKEIIDEIVSLESLKRELERAIKLYAKIEEVVHDRSIIDKYYTTHKKAMIEDALNHYNLEIADLYKQYRSIDSSYDSLNKAIESRENANERNELVKLLLEEINPTNGLIADFFQSFVNQFVDQLNIIINKVWEHPIEVLSCGIEDGGLNYKFPLRVDNKEYGPIDFSKGSNSQISIVNFAFKIVVMIYLGLEDYPLYLDELAPDLDEKHRVNIVHFVRDFVESRRCSQMFMVSHYESGYGLFTNAEILILDAENLLEIPARYNTHATLIKEKKS